MPDLDGLRLPVGVARAGSIGAAARAEGITQQAASQRLRAVETQVGVTLVRRGPRGSELTESGVVITEWATRLLDLAEEIDTAIEGLRGDRGRDLVVWASMTVAESLMPRWLVRLHQLRPHSPTGVTLTAANSRQVLKAIQEGSAHVGFVEGVSKPVGVRSVVVAHDDLVLVTAPGTPLSRRRTPLSPEEVAALSLTSREPGSGTRDVLGAALAHHRLTPREPDVELTSVVAIREAVIAGSAPAFLSRRLVTRDVGSGTLRIVDVADLDLRRHFRACWVGTATPPAGPVRDLIAIARPHRAD
ncbi:LysR family transcriptional regulator [Phycicoccus mangrovi]|uniref:LysR family transcriptional regulator n=1 Tax=Phycicoccus mangrovi TaxID=2840470 RepID=UPI0027E2A50D|nr:LysR family transcriptional regulator [Phycicoccus mangrovi]